MQDELAALSVAPPRQDTRALQAEGQARDRARRAQQLTALLEEVQVVSDVPDEERVYFGAWVTLEDEDGEESSYRLVGPDEADVKAGRLSIESPLARALLGREVGDCVRVDRPRGEMEYTLTQLSYHPYTS